MTLTGQMTQGLQNTKKSKNIVEVGFVTAQQGKAAGNQKQRKGMMKLTQQFKDKAIKYVLKYIKGVK